MFTSSARNRADTLVVPLDQSKGPGFFVRLRRNRGLQGYIFIAPWLIGFLAFGLWPLLNTFYDSFTSYKLFGAPQWIGFKNYLDIFAKDPVFVKASLNMVLYVTLSTVISICGGLSLALLLNKRFPGNHVFRVIFYLPSLLVGVAIALLFKQIFLSGSNGLANAFLGWFHIGPVNWLGDVDHPFLAVLALILVNFWFVGGTMLIFLAGLKGIASTYYEAARLDGANSWHTFWRITLPLLSPVLVFNTIMTLIGHIQVFETPLVFAAQQGAVSSNVNNPLGHNNNLATFLTDIYARAFIYHDFGYASALAVIVFVITLLLALVVLSSARRFTYYGDVEN
jgi:ABC-type sugar transport system permease subunit